MSGCLGRAIQMAPKMQPSDQLAIAQASYEHFELRSGKVVCLPCGTAVEATSGKSDFTKHLRQHLNTKKHKECSKGFRPLPLRPLRAAPPRAANPVPKAAVDADEDLDAFIAGFDREIPQYVPDRSHQAEIVDVDILAERVEVVPGVRPDDEVFFVLHRQRESLVGDVDLARRNLADIVEAGVEGSEVEASIIQSLLREVVASLSEQQQQLICLCPHGDLRPIEPNLQHEGPFKWVKLIHHNHHFVLLVLCQDKSVCTATLFDSLSNYYQSVAVQKAQFESSRFTVRGFAVTYTGPQNRNDCGFHCVKALAQECGLPDWPWQRSQALRRLRDQCTRAHEQSMEELRGFDERFPWFTAEDEAVLAASNVVAAPASTGTAKSSASHTTSGQVKDVLRPPVAVSESDVPQHIPEIDAQSSDFANFESDPVVALEMFLQLGNPSKEPLDKLLPTDETLQACRDRAWAELDHSRNIQCCAVCAIVFVSFQKEWHIIKLGDPCLEAIRVPQPDDCMHQVRYNGAVYALCPSEIRGDEFSACDSCFNALKKGAVPSASLKRFDFGHFDNFNLPTLTAIERVCVEKCIVHRTVLKISARGGQF